MSNKFSGQLTLILGLILIIFSMSVLFPALLLSLEDPEINSVSVSENSTEIIKSPLAVRVSQVNTSNVSLLVYNIDDGETAKINSLNETENTTITLNNENIKVYNQNIDSKTVLLKFEYPVYFNWPDGVIMIFDNLPKIIIFVILLFVIGVLLTLVGVFNG